MADTLYMEIVTPEKTLYRGDVKNITAPGAKGEFMVLPDHAAFFTSLEVGEMNFDQADGSPQFAAVHGGYFEVLDNRITVLADSAELAQDIDVDRMTGSKGRAEGRLGEWSDNKSQDDEDVVRALASLRRSLVRESVISKIKFG